MLQSGDDAALIALGLGIGTLPYARTIIAAMPPTVVGRFEFGMTAQGPKLLEFNAETPTFIVELFHLNGAVCADFGLRDPNLGCQEQLSQTMHEAILAGLQWVDSHNSEPLVAFTSYRDRQEERITTKYLLSLVEQRADRPYRVTYVGLDELRVAPHGLFTADGRAIDVLYKLYPTEHLVEDESRDGQPVGLGLISLVARRRLAVINPPGSFILQNKALMALLWALHLMRSPLFSPREHNWIARYLPPTYLGPFDPAEPLPIPGPYVLKPIYGREGVSVAIVEDHHTVEVSPQHLYDAQPMIVQAYVPLPTTTILTESGLLEVRLVHNCFVCGTAATAVGIRASPRRIFDDAAFFLPVCT